MKKLLLVLLVAVFTLTQLSAQESTFQKGDKIVNLGIGFGSTYYSSHYTSHSPELSVSFETDVKDGIIDKGSIGVGGYLGYSSGSYTDHLKTTNIVIGARGSFHYPLVNKLDTYAGLFLGYNINNTTYESGYGGSSGTPSGFIFAWFVGARYYFTNKFAVMGEIGYGISYLTLGVSFKI
jgi:hypothetical protein